MCFADYYERYLAKEKEEFGLFIKYSVIAEHKFLTSICKIHTDLYGSYLLHAD